MSVGGKVEVMIRAVGVSGLICCTWISQPAQNNSKVVSNNNFLLNTQELYRLSH